MASQNVSSTAAKSEREANANTNDASAAVITLANSISVPSALFASFHYELPAASDVHSPNGSLFSVLPKEIGDKILALLPMSEQLNCNKVCKIWRDVIVFHKFNTKGSVLFRNTTTIIRDYALNWGIYTSAMRDYKTEMTLPDGVFPIIRHWTRPFFELNVLNAKGFLASCDKLDVRLWWDLHATEPPLVKVRVYCLEFGPEQRNMILLGGHGEPSFRRVESDMGGLLRIYKKKGVTYGDVYKLVLMVIKGRWGNRSPWPMTAN